MNDQDVHGDEDPGSPPNIRLTEINGNNWRDVASVTPKPSQTQFVLPVTHYLCLCHYGDDWHPLAIEANGTIVGHVMWGIDPEEESVWLGGLVIDAKAQGRGVGRAAVLALIDRFTDDGRVHVALSYSPDNEIARKLYADIGFEETGEMDDDEVIARLKRS